MTSDIEGHIKSGILSVKVGTLGHFIQKGANGIPNL